jgi:hypothetical protein
MYVQDKAWLSITEKGTAITSKTAPDLPLPAGATFVGDWDKHGMPVPCRFITFGERTVTDHPARVSPHAFRWSDGSLACSGEEAPGIAILDASVQPLNSEQARELASALLAGAAELDALRLCAGNRIARANV